MARLDLRGMIWSVSRRGYQEVVVPKYMHVHHGMQGITPQALYEAHQADLDIQGEEGVDFQKALGRPGVRDGLVRVRGAERRCRPPHPAVVTRQPSG